MFLRFIFFAAATAVALAGMPAASATYDAYSFVHPKKKNKNHSIKFSRRVGGEIRKLEGVTGRKKTKFLFENSGASLGKFETSGNTATLTGIIRNAAGEGFAVSFDFARSADPGVYKKKRGVSRTDWSYYTMTTGTLTSLTDGLASFDLKMRGKKRKGRTMRALAAQFGTGANAVNIDMLGLFAQFKATEQGCDPAVSDCQHFNGHLKLTLKRNDDPTAGPSALRSAGATLAQDPALDGKRSIAVVPLPAGVLLLPAALSALTLAGCIARRRRVS